MVTSHNEEQEKRLIITPNRSLSWQQTQIFLALTAFILIAIASVFAFKGFWIILPFAGLEFAALAYCAYIVAKAGYRCEVVRVVGNEVIVEKGRIRQTGSKKSGPESRFSFPKDWVRADLQERDNQSQLMLGASGKKVELGSFLTEQDRRELFQQLKVLLA